MVKFPRYYPAVKTENNVYDILKNEGVPLKSIRDTFAKLNWDFDRVIPPPSKNKSLAGRSVRRDPDARSATPRKGLSSTNNRASQLDSRICKQIKPLISFQFIN